MTEKIIAVLAHFIILTISATGYGGILLLMAIESACIPLPSEIIMPFAGYLCGPHAEHVARLSLLWVATAGALGCNLGSAIAYWIGARGGRPAITKFGRFVLLDRTDLARAERFFARFGAITVLLGRLLPVVRTFIALPAGIAKMPQGKFHLYTFLGSWPWCFVLAWIGMRLGQAWDTNPEFRDLYHRFQLSVEVLVLIAIVWFVWTHWPRCSRTEEA
jgi:membrane protein DedA with SNARE-associated domain